MNIIFTFNIGDIINFVKLFFLTLDLRRFNKENCKGQLRIE